MNIYQKTAAITNDLGVIAKNLSVKAGKETYKAVGERDVLDAVKPLEAKYGVYSFPAEREMLECERLEKESTYNGETKKSTTFYCRMRTVYRFVNVDEPTDFFDTVVYSTGIDSQDKGDGKAMTYADKYALMKAYKISTGDDPDQDGSEESCYESRTALSANRFICECCGKEIKPYLGSDGKQVSLRAHAERSRSKFGKVLCLDCIQNQ